MSVNDYNVPICNTRLSHQQFCNDDGLPQHICNNCVSHLSRSFAFIQLCLKSDDKLRQRIEEQVRKQYVSALTEQASAKPTIKASSDTDSIGDSSEPYETVIAGEYALQDNTELVQAAQAVEQWVDSTINTQDDEQATSIHSMDFTVDDPRSSECKTDEHTELQVDLNQKTSDDVEETPLHADGEYPAMEYAAESAQLEYFIENVDDTIDVHTVQDYDVTYEEQHLEEDIDDNDDEEDDEEDDDDVTEVGADLSTTSEQTLERTCNIQPANSSSPIGLPDDTHPLKTETTDAATTKATVRPQRPRRVTRSSSNIVRPPGPPFECAECHKQLSNFNSYKYHMRLHSDDEPFVCTVCGERFKTPNAYDGHMVTHNANNPHTCDQCGKSYRQAASLRSHMLMHTGEKPFRCAICGKGMTQKSGYKKHMLTHSGEKPHQCDVCSKSFRFSSNLFMHKRSHLNERPFTCDICDKAFVYKEQLKRHRIRHSGTKKFTCDVCDKSFNRRATMMVCLVWC